MKLKTKNLIYLFIPIIIVFTYPLLNAIIYNLLLYISSLYDGLSNFLENNYAMTDTLISLLLIILFFPLYKWITKNKITLQPIKSNFILLSIPFSLALGGISYIVLDLIERFLVPIGILKDEFTDFSNMWTQFENGAYFWVFLSIVFIGPLFEEILFRGIVYNFLEKYKSGLFPAILSGVLFGIWHGQAVQSIYTAIMGLILGYTYMKTKNLFYPVLLHMLNNFYSTLPPSMQSDYIYNIIDFVSVLMVVPFSVMFILKLKKYRENNKLKEREAE
ncbi:CPBP family intramembrane glutamic endopeptidase [Peptoniphilus indolicus]|uniref:CAAX amino protease n=2 Tax=Peptoniphilus indolicus TaxID=33030 RepID=G4D3M5_9FIRM|nr:type II CAAX endopeptidase family protein [Peptoniphilus indolicus]EGY79867.1 CAAX amino protease [Peptoniphilus indolicus ATCC 29427]SUB75701.1 CAAX amino terminal protease self- immunity [Peptoniphilus indolicus]